jgi:hypothetical protein
MDDDLFTTDDFYAELDGGEEISDEVAEATEVTPEGASPELGDEGGQAEATVEQERKYFDPSQYADQLVRVKVDGEEVEVPVTDLVNGYSRTADYTRKTQALAAEAEQVRFWKQVDAAMQHDPEKTLEYLRSQYGAQVAQQASDAYDNDDEWDDPAAQQLREFQQQVAPELEWAREQRAAAYLDNVLSTLSSRYGDAFDAQEVVKYAVDRGIHNPDMLDACFKEIYTEKALAREAAQRQIAQATAAEDAGRQAAAANAALVIGSGSGASKSGAATAPPAPRGRLTVQEAWAAAKAELGY